MSEARDFRWSLAFFAQLASYAETRDATVRRRLAATMARTDFEDASIAGCLWLALLPVVAILLVAAWQSWWIVLIWLAVLPAALGTDAIVRRRAANRSLERGELETWSRVRVGDSADGIFQSYWVRPGHPGELELDHPDALRSAVEAADEVWFWRMPLPMRNNLGLRWVTGNWPIGLVRRVGEHAELVGASETFYDYDPWTGRILR